ncbi:MAG: NAD(P)H-quinone oxidoreductase chain 4 1 [Bacteroidetes bacterium ADurb.Bin217]|nr:MAG: NAD(P)H-quinone oxidoreductase chain 4 1 [Bacteroidetes bacterium ADurb.Bin217]
MGGLMKVIPFISVVYVIAGLASLGLPGLSGFVAEMTIFVGSFQHADTFHRVCTILAASAIVITAVYILRVVGILLFGPVKNPEFNHLQDATWFEKVSMITLVVSIVIIGFAPLWLSEIIRDSLTPIVERLALAGN